MESKTRLDEELFTALIHGKTVKITLTTFLKGKVHSNVELKIILADIGYDRMLQIIQEAQQNMYSQE